MESTNKNDIKYLNAKKRVKQIKGFYIHLAVYIGVVGLSLCLKFLKHGNLGSENFWGFGLWGIGLLIHGLTVFLPNFILGSNWEERKIKELMEKNRK